MKMKNLIIPVVAAAFILLSMQNCGKGGGGSCSEPAMTVVTTPANGSVEPPGVGPNFDVQVNITANKPSAGVTIEVKAHPEGNSTNFFTTSPPVSTTNANNTITILNTPAAVPCVVDIIVTSKSCASNKVTLSYKYSKK